MNIIGNKETIINIFPQFKALILAVYVNTTIGIQVTDSFPRLVVSKLSYQNRNCDSNYSGLRKYESDIMGL